MEELWRVCKDGALVNVWVPHASCPFVTWIDPTHQRYDDRDVLLLQPGPIT
jgi:hypothetical protein